MPPGPSPSRPRRLATVAALAVAATAGVMTLTRVFNFDIYWHLAAGDWMLRHGRVLGHDPFSVDPQPQWVNVHWLFQLVVAALHAVWGFAALSVLKAALAAAGLAVFACSLRRRIPTGWLLLVSLATLVVVFDRVRARPEAFTLLYLFVTVAVLERARLGRSPRIMWLLVPTMLLWVNMHGLYVLGLGLIWAAMLGALLDPRFRPALAAATDAGASTSVEGDGAANTPGLASRGALAPALAATAVCLLTPWPVEAALHPLLLWTRISGEQAFYTYGVAELQPTLASWATLRYHWAAGALVLLALLAAAMSARRVPIAHWLWLAAFVVLALLARRNVPLVGPVAGWVLAIHGADVLRRIGRGRQRLARGAARTAAVAGFVCAAALTAGSATELLYRVYRPEHRFGVGARQLQFPVETARFLAELPGRGDLMCADVGDASVFVYHTWPARRVWMDGRLEAHSRERFVRQLRLWEDLARPQSAATAELPDRVRFVVATRSSPPHLRALMQSPRFRLIHLTPIAACFERTDWHGEPALPAGPDLSRFDRRFGLKDSLEGYPDRRRRWWRQNEKSLVARIGQMLSALGEAPPPNVPVADERLIGRLNLLGLRFFLAAEQEGLAPRLAVRRGVARAALNRSLLLDEPPGVLPVDVYSAMGLRYYEDLYRGEGKGSSLIAYERVEALLQARQLDAAAAALDDLLDLLPPARQVRRPAKYLRMQDLLDRELARARQRAEAMNLDDLLPVERADALCRPDVGLIDQAIAELRAVPDPGPDVRAKLAELLLRRGLADQAMRVAQPTDRPPFARLCSALCDWMNRDLSSAVVTLVGLIEEEDAAEPVRAVSVYYLVTLMELTGEYDLALGLIDEAERRDPRLAELLADLRARLPATPRD